MAILDIRKYPDPVLAEECRLIQEVDEDLRTLAEDMAETMYSANGIGLAAPQVGHSIRLIVVDTSEDQSAREPMVLFNPEITGREGEILFNEGCLSVPDYTSDVIRSEKVTVRAMNLEGQEVVVEAEGVAAVCLQHEIDHLDGCLFIDRISQLKRSLYRKRRMKQIRREAS